MQTRSAVYLDAFAVVWAKGAFIGLRLSALFLCSLIVDRSIFGEIALAYTTAEVVRFTFDWGTDTWALRQFSHPDLNYAKQRLHWVFLVKSVTTLPAFLSSLGLISYLSPSLSLPESSSIALTTVSSVWMNLGTNWLQARGQLRPMAARLPLAAFLCLSYQFLYARHEPSCDLIIFSNILTELTIAVYVTNHSLRNANLLKAHCLSGLKTTIKIWRWLSEVTPIALTTIIGLAYGRVDQYFVYSISSSEIFGNYAFAQRIAEPLQFVMVALTSTLYAKASMVAQNNGNSIELAGYAKRWTTVVCAATASIAIAILLVLYTFRTDVLPAADSGLELITIALTCAVFRCTNLTLTAFIQALGAYSAMLRISMINAVTVCSFVFIGGYAYGALGAAFGVVVGECINTLIQITVLKSTLTKRA